MVGFVAQRLSASGPVPSAMARGLSGKRKRAGAGLRDGSEAGRRLPAARRGAHEVASVQKITLSTSRDIPFNKLVLSQANVRRIVAGISSAADSGIPRRVRPSANWY